MTAVNQEREMEEGQSCNPIASSTPPPSYPSPAPTMRPNSPILPRPSASEDEVRDYIRSLLVVKHNIAVETANATATRFYLGRGWGLRAMHLEKYNEIFGTEFGRYLHVDVRQALDAEALAEDRKEFESWKHSQMCWGFFSKLLVLLGIWRG